MVVKTDSEYVAFQLLDRVKYLQSALNHAEKIMHSFERENERLKDILNSLMSEKNESYSLCGEGLDEQTYLL